MKIGILTLWQSSDNYGQQLQCWALQQQLLKMGHEPYLIRYDIEHRVLYKTPWWKKLIKLILLYPVYKRLKKRKQNKEEKKLIEYNALKNKNRDFESFRKNNLLMSEKLYSSLQELRDNPPKADAYIVGSDQVWAHLLSFDENRAMFLDFGDENVKRIAYAPSFSMPKYPEHLNVRLKENLSRFDSLSVREQTGVRICKGLGYDAQVVVDPTMLLKKEDYLSIKCKEQNGQYIYLYYLNIANSKEIEWQKLKLYSQLQNIRIIATPATGYIQGRELFDGVDYVYATILQWIDLIDKAQLVVTTSFHGVVFCIIHHTPFVYFPLQGKYSRGNNRVLDLCNMLHLNDRIWKDDREYSFYYSNLTNWEEVDRLLDIQRELSIEYLKCLNYGKEKSALR